MPLEERLGKIYNKHCQSLASPIDKAILFEQIVNLPNNGKMAKKFSEFAGKVVEKKHNKQINWSKPVDMKK
jgi:hypothetical protein